MGAGASASREDKKKIVSELGKAYEQKLQEITRRTSLDEKQKETQLLEFVKSEYIKKTAPAGDAADGTKPGAVTAAANAPNAAAEAAAPALRVSIQANPDLDAAAALAAITPPSPSGGNEFRRRRLTFASQGRPSSNALPGEQEGSWAASWNRVTSASNVHALSPVIFQSHEMGVEPDKEPPFPRTVVGTYSCHGIEPSWEDNDAVCSKINQDRGCIVYPFLGRPDAALFCVFDGHGERGDAVSNFAMHEIPPRLAAHPNVEKDPPNALSEVFVAVDHALASQPGVDAQYSGTTAVAVLMLGKKLFVANAGDSRAVLATVVAPAAAAAGGKGAAAAAAAGKGLGAAAAGKGKVQCVALTEDHDPDRPSEKKRILAAGGFVSPPPEEGLSARVWLDPEMTQIGLAMARSIGDHAVKTVGVIAEPEVRQHDIAESDAFLVMGSDGVWEFLESQKAVELVAAKLASGHSGGAAHACEELIAAAAIEWQAHEGDYRDDITALVIKLPCV